MRFGRIPLALAALTTLVSACATYQTELNQGIKYHSDSEYEKSLAVFRALEPDIDSLKADDRVRYYYYRGMTDFRLNTDKYDVAADARHWLALAAAAELETPSSLTNKQVSFLCDALGELNKQPYNQGASDTAVVEFKICKDKTTDAGLEASDKGDKKKGDDADAKPKKKGDDDGDSKPKKKKGSDELALPPPGESARGPPTSTRSGDGHGADRVVGQVAAELGRLRARLRDVEDHEVTVRGAGR